VPFLATSLSYDPSIDHASQVIVSLLVQSVPGKPRIAGVRVEGALPPSNAVGFPVNQPAPAVANGVAPSQQPQPQPPVQGQPHAQSQAQAQSRAHAAVMADPTVSASYYEGSLACVPEEI
jgi:predicted component of type VI protein secretion system